MAWNNPKTTPISRKPSYAYYKGPYPESEPEAKVVANWIRNNRPKLLLDYHSSGEIFFWYYNQTGAALERDRKIARAMAAYSGYAIEPVNPNKVPSSNLTRWASQIMQIPSICVEVGTGPSYNLTMEKLPGIFTKTKYLPLIAAMNLPDYQPYVPVSSVRLSSSTLLAVPGSAETLTATVFPANASNKKVIWSSGNPQVASVDSSGRINVYSLGSTTITATTEDKGESAFCSVTVYPKLPRLQGTDRYVTAVEISRSGWDYTQNVVLVRGDDFSDAAVNGYPILLTGRDKLSPETLAYISEAEITRTLVIGGNSAVSEAVFRQLPQPHRISGATRYDTAIEGYIHFYPLSDSLFVSTGHSFADALTGAALAAKHGAGVLLVGSQIPQTLDLLITEKQITSLTIFGGSGAIPSSVEASISRMLQK
ncbi:MAG: cell wall-binding repeat-containing protein [Dethiobacter sp.]|nr:cell wall-binding repeat-containing protein [Dethiobacter sp.]MBS4022646.1 cell wall-binding repeat-containing protein [Dethiobacter sp.]